MKNANQIMMYSYKASNRRGATTFCNTDPAVVHRPGGEIPAPIAKHSTKKISYCAAVCRGKYNTYLIKIPSRQPISRRFEPSQAEQPISCRFQPSQACRR